jgi:hypothetical protein
MTCKCKEHKEEYTCSGNDCQVCVLDEENYIENPQSKKERYNPKTRYLFFFREDSRLLEDY